MLEFYSKNVHLYSPAVVSYFTFSKVPQEPKDFPQIQRFLQVAKTLIPIKKKKVIKSSDIYLSFYKQTP